MMKKLFSHINLFSKTEKAKFALKYYQDNILYVRIFLILFFLLSLVYFYLDYASAPISYPFFWVLRSIHGILLPITFFILSFNKKLKIVFINLAGSFFTFSYNLAILLMIYFSLPVEISKMSYLQGLGMVFIGALGLRINHKYIVYTFTIIIVLLLVLVFYVQKDFFLQDIPVLTNNLYFVFTTYIGVIIISYILDKYAIENFLYINQLSQKNQKLIEQNQEINMQNRTIEKQKKQLEKNYKIIEDSINYAYRIQSKVLPYNKIDTKNTFVLFKGKTKISGDFFYYKEYDNLLIFAVGDCTGHGIPGSMLSMMSISLLDDIIGHIQSIDLVAIFNYLDRQVKNILGNEVLDGLELGMFILNPQTGELTFAGANRNFIIVRDNQIIEIKGTKRPIGNYPFEKKFIATNIKLENGDTLYLFSDGYSTQLNSNNRVFSRLRFKNLLIEISSFSLSKQKEKLLERLESWKQTQMQTDDITVLGYRYSV